MPSFMPGCFSGFIPGPVPEPMTEPVPDLGPEPVREPGPEPVREPGPEPGPELGRECVARLVSVLVTLRLSVLMTLAGLSLLAPIASALAADADEANWARTVSRTADSVVSLKLSQLRNFDDAEQGNSNATGFVVDAVRGIVLTNRHVVGSGPVRLSATFQNQERVDAVPLYRDPIHDFAFVRYDPAMLRYAKPSSLALRPDKVATGMNIRVIGSDGGEQLSILPGTIARLDREVPSYGRYGYNDFNTFYLQAASGTSGGSSGSPVIDIDGDVVALNAAANTRTASSFFLPLPRIVHALERLRLSLPIERGSLQTIFSHQPFRELTRLGLDTDTEARVRASGESVNGLLVVQQIIPGGVADGVLEEGDILVDIDTAIVADFVALEAMLDESLGKTLDVGIIRQGGYQQVSLDVADLHALAPSRLVELGDAVLQDMSIQHARAMNRAQRGVVVMRSGYFFTRAKVPQGAVVLSLDGEDVDDLDDFLAAVRAATDPSRMRIRYIVPGREFTPAVAQFGIDNRWFGHRECARVDDVRFWDCQAIDLPSSSPGSTPGTVRLPSFNDALMQRVAPGIVRVEFHVPYPADNVYARHFSGSGIVVDAIAGIVAVDRNTVPIGLGDTELTFFGSHDVDAQVVFLHPRHNIALLRYDPRDLGKSQPPSIELADEQSDRLGESADASGHLSGNSSNALTMIGMRDDGTFRRTTVNEMSRLTIGFSAPGLPRFQQTSLDVFGVPNMPPSLGGPLVDADGIVHALYTSFAYEEDREIRQGEWALPIGVVSEALALYRSGEHYRSLGVMLDYRPLAEARRLGLPDDWLERYGALDASSRRVLYVTQVVPGRAAPTEAAPTAAEGEAFETGDVLLAIDGELVADLFAAERRAQRDSVSITVLRDHAIVELEVIPKAQDVLGTERLVSWGGAYFQEPHGEIAVQKGVDVAGVYIADTVDGSPAMWDGLWRNRFVVAVDGEPVVDLDDFLARVASREQDEITRLTVVSMSGRRQIVTVEPEYNFWPTFEVMRGQNGWQRINHLN